MAIELIDKIKPKNGGSFPMVDAEDVACGDGRLPDFLPVVVSQEEYDQMVADGTVNENTLYFVKEG